MKSIGIYYNSGYGPNIGLILWCLRNYDIQVNSSDGHNTKGRYFQIITDNFLYKFSNVYSDLLGCDKFINLEIGDSLTHNPEYKFDMHVYGSSDVLINELTDEKILNFLNDGNLIIFGGVDKLKHPNLIADPLFILVYFYYKLGYNYLNFPNLPVTEYKGLLGVYHRRIHNSGRISHERDNVVNYADQLLKDDLYIYSRPKNSYQELLESVKYFYLWYNNHASTYTDYKTSVCNILLESCGAATNAIEAGRTMLTEKTMKAILFSAEDIFFIWYGAEFYYKILRDYGFWFLNSEFYDAANNSNYTTAVTESVKHSVQYLKELKHSLGTNKKVHEYLMNIHGTKLENNVRLFKHLEENCPYKDYILNKIQEGL